LEKTDKTVDENAQQKTGAATPEPSEHTAMHGARGLEGEAHLEALPEITEFQEGFSWNTLIGAFFVGIIMMPAAIYLGLVTGSSGITSTAEWVTIILFTYVAQRSYTRLRKQEIYILFYVAAALSSMGAHQLAGGPFATLIWNQYLVQSPAARAFGIADKIPTWVVPRLGSPALVERSFLHPDWLAPIILLLIGQVLHRGMSIGLGYAMFRITSDIERLPFPLAPVSAAGATALGEAAAEKESWRWNVFSIGTMIGLVWGVFYVGIPTVTASAFNEAVQLIPIPFIDLVQNTEHVFPGAQIAIGSDIVSVLAGFVLPFWLIVGEFIAAMISQLVVAPQLVKHGMLPHWHPGMNVIQTGIATSVDFWMSVGIGGAIVVAIIGLANIVGSALRSRNRRAGDSGAVPRALPPGRGDWSIALSVGVWAFGTFCYIAICHYLVPDFPVGLLVFYGLIWTPLNSYISARMYGITGRGVAFPYLREASFVLSGYRGVDIWFAPIPLADYGGQAQFFRSVELTGTKFTSILKAEVMIVPIILGFSFVFWTYFWRMGEIPSALYPYANRMWPVQSIYAALWPTATLTPESNWLLKAIKWDVIGGAAACGFGMYAIVSLLKLPQMLFYGLVTGMGMQTTGVVPMFIGAMLGRFYFAKRFGSRWGAYTPVLMAGYSCGMGLVGMAGVALGMIAKSTSYLPY